MYGGVLIGEVLKPVYCHHIDNNTKLYDNFEIKKYIPPIEFI